MSKVKKDVQPKIPQISPGGMPSVKRFVLNRNEDETGTSGTGIVAIGVMFPSGICIIEWCSVVRCIGTYHSIADLEAIHGHGGKTIVEWID